MIDAALHVLPRLAAAALLVAASGVARGSGPCQPPDNVTWVAGGGECLAIRTFAAGDRARQPTLFVTVHGDTGPTTRAAERYHEALGALHEGRIVTVALVRPGFSDDHGRYCSGHSDTSVRGSSYNERNTVAIAEAVDALRRHHHAARVVVLGVSGGAALLANALALRPGIAPDVAILAACPCDVPGARHRPDPRRMLSAMDSDGDGRISRNEWRGPPARFRMLDADGDGFVTLEELEKGRTGARKGEAAD